MSAGPDPHPQPDPALMARSLPIVTDAGPWLRVHPLEKGPLYFGRTLAYRFDDPEQKFGVLYTGHELAGCFIEVFGSRLRTGTLTVPEIQRRGVSRVTPKRPARLVDLAGPGLARLNADARLGAGDYSISQPWSRALHDHPDAPDGLLYRSRRNPAATSVALFERFQDQLDASDTQPLFQHAEFAATVDLYRFAIVGS